MSFRASVLTLYPEMFPGPLGHSLAGRALENGTWTLEPVQIRDFATDRHRTVDDTPAGGGAGMVMRADVLARAIDHASPAGDGRPRLLMSPRGRPLDQSRVRDLAGGEGVVILCGRFEGVDQRVIEARGLEEVSIGDFILSGGETAALVLLDAVVRLLPGVMGNVQSGEEESFENGLLEHPHYKRPQEFEGRAIPEVLISGNHARIAAWRRAEAVKLTEDRRPDLIGQGRTIQTSASVRFFGDDLDPDELTSLLGRNPTNSARKGEPKRSGHLNRTGIWEVSSEYSDGDQLGTQIRELLGTMTSDLTIWKRLVGRYDVDVFCGVWLIGKPGITVEPDVMVLLSERGLNLELDIYTDTSISP